MLGRHNAENALAALRRGPSRRRRRGRGARGAASLRRREAPPRGARRRRTASWSTTISRITRRRSRRRSTACGARPRGGRVIAVLEPRSNTMKLGTHKAALAKSLHRRRPRVRVPVARSEVGRRRRDGAARRARHRARGPAAAGGGARSRVASGRPPGPDEQRVVRRIARTAARGTARARRARCPAGEA